MMNKLCKILLSITMVAISFTMLDQPIFNPIVEVQADFTSTACGSSYEVAIANAGGSFTTRGCYGDFTSAQNVMKTLGDDAVVRHNSSLSPMKIISMVSGIAVTYPMRSGSTTMNITQDHSSSNRKTTYTTKHREMKYFETRSYNGSGNGSVYINMTGFNGLVDLMNVDLVPYSMLGNATTVLLGGNDTTAAAEAPFWTHIYQSHYEVTQSGANKELTFYAYSGWSSDTWPAKYTMTVGLAADWMTVGTTYYSYDGYSFYSDAKYRNKVGTYYNYYQFLPTRTRTTIPATAFDSYLVSVKGSGTNSKMKNKGQAFIDAQNAYGVNALLVYALSCLESAYGTSTYALEKNNLFGWNAFDSSPGSASTFPSIDAAINEHMGINLRGYLNTVDARFFGSHVGNKGSGFNVKYASDPYWGYKIAAIAYSIDKSAGFVDYNKYSVGLVNTYGVNILKTPNGTTLFNSAYGATYQENFTVAVLANESNHSKIQTTNPVSNGSLITGTTTGLVIYDWNQSVGYLPANYVTMLSGSVPSQGGTTPTGDFVSTLETLKVNQGKLTIKGTAYRPGIYVTDSNKVVQKLIVTDNSFKETAFTLTSTVSDNDKITFSGEIDLSTLPVGKYYFDVVTEYSALPAYNQTKMLPKQTSYDALVTYNNRGYELFTFEDIVKLSITESTVVTPTPTPDTGVEKILKQDILSFGYLADNKTVKIEGYSFISGMNAKSDTQITQEVYLLDLETKTKVPFQTKLITLPQPLALNDGFEYSKVKYEAELDLTTVAAGNYAIYIRVQNGTEDKTAELKNYYTTVAPVDKSFNDTKYRFVISSLYGYRYELRAEKTDIDYSVMKKPLKRSSTFDFNSISLANGKLAMDGVAWMYGTDMNTTTNPQYSIIFLNKEGVSVEKAVTTKACALNYTQMLKLDFDTSKACFDASIDLTTLPDNEYTVYLKFKNNTYTDIIEMYDMYARVVAPVTLNGKLYKFNTIETRKRFKLVITPAS